MELLLCHSFLQVSAPGFHLPIQSLAIITAIISGVLAIIISAKTIVKNQKELVRKQAFQEKEQESLSKAIVVHTKQIDLLNSKESIVNFTNLCNTVEQHDKEIKRLAFIHDECSKKQSATTTAIFKEIKELSDKFDTKLGTLTSNMDNKFTIMQNQIIDLIKAK